MKILIVGLTKIKYMPYLNFYLNGLDVVQNDIHVAYWNRDSKEEDLSCFPNVFFHEFKFTQTNGVKLIKKIRPYLLFRKEIIKLIKTYDFDFFVFLHTPSSLLVYNLIGRFKGKYIFDYRDSTYESKRFFRMIVGKIVKKSLYTFVSSDKFRKFLPSKCSHKIFTTHNLLVDSLTHRSDRKKCLIQSKRIRLSFWGFIRNLDLNKEIIRKVSKDSRFELHYFGREQETALCLKQYALSLDTRNVFFHGEYCPNDRYEIIKSTDLIHNIYLDRNMMIAMGNKYYDGIIFRIPQLCFKGSFMGELSTKNKIGLEVNPFDETFLDQIFGYYNSLDWDAFFAAADVELERVLLEYNKCLAIIKSLC